MIRSRRARAQKRTLHCEFLEDRRVLATFTVNSLGDTADANPGDGIAADANGDATLRAAVEEANALAGADDINFTVAGNIVLSLGTLNVTEDLMIDGGGSVSVDGNAASTVMSFTGGSSQLTDITITNGSAVRGGGINASADLTLSGATVSNSYASEMGGGIFSSADLDLTNNSLVTGNSVGSAGSTAFGGGVVSYQGTLDINDSTVSMNTSSQYFGGVLGFQGDVTITNNSYITANVVNHTAGGFSSGAGVSMASSLYFGSAGSAPFTLSVEDSTVNDNYMYGTNFPYGGAFYSIGYGDVDITRTMITGNSIGGSGGARGAAGFNWPADDNGPGTLNVNIVDSVIDNNHSSEQSGGFGFRSVSINNGVVMNITGTTISNNTSQDGGAAGFNWSAGDDPASAVLNITNSMITGNSSATTGGAFETNNANFTISDSTIDGNTAATTGGAIYSTGSDLLTYYRYAPVTRLIRTTVSNNSSSYYGGGAYAYDATLVLDNSTVSGNSSMGNGGGIMKLTNYAYVGSPYISNVELLGSTVTNNYSAATGGGIYGNYYSTFLFHNSILSGNSANISGNDIYSTLTPDTTYSLIGDGSYAGLVAANPDINGNIIGDNVSPIDAMLGGLANNGGPTLTHLPMGGSLAINAGDMATMGGTDQTGGARVNDGRVDMGSVETGMSAPSGDFNNDGNWDCTDINALTAVTAAGTNDPMFDMTGDGLVNGADINEWLIVGGAMNPAATGGNPFLPGDADLNGAVDGADFIAWNTNKFSTSTDWCGGNFDGNGATDGGDFIIWNTNKFQSSDSAAFGNDDLAKRQNNGSNRLMNGQRGKKQLLAREPGSGARANARPVVLDLDSVDQALRRTEKVAVVAAVPQAPLAVPQVALQSHATDAFSTFATHDSLEDRDEALDQVFAGF